MNGYVYIESERFTDDDGVVRILYTVGFYGPDGKFVSESDHDNIERAAARVSYLNGGTDPEVVDKIKQVVSDYLCYGISLDDVLGETQP